jgi:hypothetical protein
MYRTGSGLVQMGQQIRIQASKTEKTKFLFEEFSAGLKFSPGA